MTELEFIKDLRKFPITNAKWKDLLNWAVTNKPDLYKTLATAEILCTTRLRNVNPTTDSSGVVEYDLYYTWEWRFQGCTGGSEEIDPESSEAVIAYTYPNEEAARKALAMKLSEYLLEN